MVKKGDTLIEVTIAIGIFSMIAIAIASVMSSGTSGSQTALETTLAREEIDAQAEALRFVHASYISSRNYRNKESTDDEDTYQNLWKAITSDAINESTEYNPSSCDELYNDPGDGSNQSLIQKQKAFVLNPKNLDSKDAYISADDVRNSGLFTPTTTYPRLIFTDKDDGTGDSDSALIDSNDKLFQVAGIYVVAVQDPGTTQIAGNNNTSAFYDFYIRTCWYGTDATRPSTISTVIRLYDPDVSVSN